MKLKNILTLITAFVALDLAGVAVLPREASPVSANGCPGPRVAERVADVKGENSSLPVGANSSLSALTGIAIRSTEVGEGSLVDVTTTRPAPYRVLQLTDPNRLVLDLEGARNATHRRSYSSSSPCSSRIRLGRFSEDHGGVVWVVADLEGNPSARVRKESDGFRIDLVPRSDSQEAEKPSGFRADSASEKAQMISDPPAANEAAKAADVLADETEGKLWGSASQTKRFEGAENLKYTGKAISLNLKNVDLKDFFRLIHEISGLNIIVDSDVSGTVTMVLDDVPWDQALDIVLKNNGLGDQLEGNVLRIAKISTLVAEQKGKRKLSEAKEEAAPLVTVFYPINYAKAATIAALLKSWSGGGALSRRGTVLVDERTNTLIISDIPTQIPSIKSIVGKLDRKSQQVSIQARIIRATSDFARNLSTALSFAQRNRSGSLTTGGATGSQVTAQPLAPPTVTTSPATGFGVFVISNLGANYAINAAIAAAESHDQAKTISRPSIVTQDNVEGTVIQGTRIPIQTTINNTISVQYVQASLELQVTPQVTDDGHVFLTINIQNSSPGPALTLAGPTINTQSATTQVLVPDGGTVVFGGVTVTTRSTSSTGIPLLDSIPILGHLFKSTTAQKNDQELLFFVTPKVLRS